MNPVPLKDPTGKVIAYACGVCWRAPSHSVPLMKSYAKPNREELAWRKREAKHCCKCFVHGCERQEQPNGMECDHHATQRENVKAALPPVPEVDIVEAYEREMDEERLEELEREVKAIRERIEQRVRLPGDER